MSIWLEPPFNLLCSGITNCGKTHYILDLLETVYKNKFDYVVIYCPTYLVNKTYEREFLNNNDNVIIIKLDHNLDELLQINMKHFANIKTLFLIDDCANLHDSKIKESSISQLAFHGRHYGISTWIITQKYNAIVKDFRDNIKMLILFFDKDRESMKSAFIENHVIPVELHNEVMDKLKQENTKLIVRLQQPFSYIIISK